MTEQESTILIHVTTVPGTLSFLRGQIGYMQRKGFAVHVVSSPDSLLDEFAGKENVTAHAIPMERRISPFRDLQALFALSRLLWRIKPTVVHAQTPKAGLLASVAAWLTGVPVRVYSILGLPFMTKTGLSRWLLLKSEWVSCRLATQVLAVSQAMRQGAIAENLCSADKIAVLHNGSINGIDADYQFNPETFDQATLRLTREALNIQEGSPIIGFVGRVVRDKGIIELAAAWSVWCERYPDVHLLIVGPIEPHDPIPPEVEHQLRSDPRVHLTGFVPDHRLHFALMDIVVLPTYREGFPVTPLEAAAMGLPVVATSVPGCTEAVVDGVTGILVPPNDSKSLAQAVARYLDNPTLAKMHGQAGRKRVLSEFQQEPIWEALYHTYARLLRNNGFEPPVEACEERLLKRGFNTQTG